MDSLPSQSVAIDGLQVRKIREEKRLTQFYIAKVVGVTTDTVSRWENNRYPTIRRDNAVNLADALEVELEDILKKEPEADISTAEETASSAKKNRRNLSYLAVIFAFVVLAIIYLLLQNNGSMVPVLTAERILPAYAAPGSRILIQTRIQSEKPLKGMILKEKFPQGWRLIESIPVASSVDAQAEGARWIFRKPLQTLTVYSILEVAADTPLDSPPNFAGEVIANPDGRHSAVVLETVGSLQIKPLHWADGNGNGMIDDLEILEVSEIIEETGALNLEWDQIEALWEAEGYQWQPDKRCFVPVSEPSK